MKEKKLSSYHRISFARKVERDSGANARQENSNLQTATGLAVLKS